jgi:hypothetical protein
VSGRREGARDEALVGKFALVWIAAAVVVSVVGLIAYGRLSAPVTAVDAIAAMLVPFGLLSLVFVFVGDGGEEPRADDDGSGGGGGPPPHDPGSLPPLGGLDIDWERFEADLQAYTRTLEPVG